MACVYDGAARDAIHLVDTSPLEAFVVDGRTSFLDYNSGNLGHLHYLSFDSVRDSIEEASVHITHSELDVIATLRKLSQSLGSPQVLRDSFV